MASRPAATVLTALRGPGWQGPRAWWVESLASRASLHTQNMFEDLVGTPASGIALETSKGTPIDNEQGPELDQHGLDSVARRRLEITGWAEVRRRPAGAIYNCAGLIWASRRTAIYSASDYGRILDDDGYRTLVDAEQPELGDLAVYYLEGTDKIVHVGVVVKFGPPLQRALVAADVGVGVAAADANRVPYVLSKDNAGDEIVHHMERYDPGLVCTVRVWTDRPKALLRHA